MRVVDTVGLGWDSALCEIEGEQVLFLDSSLNEEARVEVMTDVMAGRF